MTEASLVVIAFAASFVAAQLPVLPDSILAQRKGPDSARAVRPPFHPEWPVDSTDLVCGEPLETALECWRASKLWANQEIGFPGARSTMLSLSSLEPAATLPFFQPELAASPYGMGGRLPFDRLDENRLEEKWLPVSPVDTPVTALHWTRGALGMNLFTLDLRRMVGDRAYLSLQYHSDQAQSRFYDYAFNTHQPYLSGWGLGQWIPSMDRDSASLVLSDTSHSIGASQVRPRVGFWIDSQTVFEVFADWADNTSTLAMPTYRARNDSIQLLYPASFSGFAAGAVAARRSDRYALQASFRHSGWDRTLQPLSAVRSDEFSSGISDLLRTEMVLQNLPGRPRLGLSLETALRENALRLKPGDSLPAPEAWSDREKLEIEAKPGWGPLASRLRAEGERRKRPDGKNEWLGGAEASSLIRIPGNFHVTGAAGWRREGAPEDMLYRLQPALGLFPSPGLEPRTDLNFQAGAGWESRHLGAGVSWDRHRFGDNWLPNLLPDGYASSTAVADSLALGLVNTDEEIRDLLHLSLFLGLGNWKLSLFHTYLLDDKIRGAQVGSTDWNWRLPARVNKGQLGWRRTLLGGKLEAETRWDWEWFSTRYAYASDGDGTSRTVKLDEYLVLDFTASMKVKTFLLHFRAMNFNHDRYATEPGVHPPGVNFRFGIDWRLWN